MNGTAGPRPLHIEVRATMADGHSIRDIRGPFIFFKADPATYYLESTPYAGYEPAHVTLERTRSVDAQGNMENKLEVFFFGAACRRMPLSGACHL